MGIWIDDGNLIAAFIAVLVASIGGTVQQQAEGKSINEIEVPASDNAWAV